MRSKLLALTAAALLTPACASFVSTSGGYTTIKFGAEAEYEKLKVLNDQVNAARKRLLERFGDDAAAEQATIEALEKDFAVLRAQLSKMRAKNDAYKSVDENLTDAENWNATTKVGLAAQQKLKDLESRVMNDPGLTAQELDAGEAVVKAFTINVRKEWKNVADNDTRRMSKLRQDTAAGPELREKARQEAEARAAAKAKEEARKQAEQARHEGRVIEEKVRNRLGNAEVPSQEEIDQLAAAVAKVAAISPDEARHGERLLLDARVALALDGENPGPAVQALFQGTLASSGQSKGKALSVPLSVKKNHCVVWVARYSSFTGTEGVNELMIKVPDATAAQQFSYHPQRVRNGDRPAFELKGLCAIRELKGTVTAKLEFTGTKNGLKYVVLDSERAGFPKALASKVRVSMPDHCDPEAWAAMWLTPIPGSFGYLHGEPVVVGDGNIHYAAGPDQFGSSYGYDDVKREAPKAVKFTHQLQWKACNLDYGDAPVTKALKACSDRIEARYASQWVAIDRARDVASGMSNSVVKYYSPAAEEKASRLRDAYDRDFARECQPMQDKAQKAFEKRFEKLVDQLTDARPVDVLFDTAAR